MQTYQIDIFGGDSDTPQLRLLDDGGKVVQTRVLDGDEVAAMVAQAKAAYQRQHADLDGAGEKLHAWLDGDAERWLEAQHDAAASSASTAS